MRTADLKAEYQGGYTALLVVIIGLVLVNTIWLLMTVIAAGFGSASLAALVYCSAVYLVTYVLNQVAKAALIARDHAIEQGRSAPSPR